MSARSAGDAARAPDPSSGGSGPDLGGGPRSQLAGPGPAAGGPGPAAGGPGPASRSVVWLDGRLVPAADPHLSVADRGFQLGDGIFETLRARRGVPIEWAEHAARLEASAAALAIRLPFDADALRAAVTELLAAAGLDRAADPDPGDAAVRITVSRGAVEGRGLLPPGWRSVRPTVAIQVWPSVAPPEAVLTRGVRAITSAVRRDPDHPLAGVKTTSRADHVYARLEAERAGVDDALFLTIDGRIAEATSANVVLVSGDRLRTPTLGTGILAGTTRSWLLRAPEVATLGLDAIEADCRPADLAAADEAFLCSSVAGIVPLVEVDGRPIGDGRPGRRSLALRAARETWVDAAARRELGEV